MEHVACDVYILWENDYIQFTHEWNVNLISKHAHFINQIPIQTIPINGTPIKWSIPACNSVNSTNVLIL